MCNEAMRICALFVLTLPCPYIMEPFLTICSARCVLPLFFSQVLVATLVVETPMRLVVVARFALAPTYIYTVSTPVAVTLNFSQYCNCAPSFALFFSESIFR